jgi:O-antigen ligase
MLLWSGALFLVCKRNSIKLKFDLITIIMSAYYLWLLVAIIYSYASRSIIFDFTKIMAIPLLFYICKLANFKPKIWRAFDVCLFIATTVYALLLIHQFYTTGYITILLGNKNINAIICALVSLWALAYYLKAKHKLLKYSFGSVILILTYVVALVHSRGVFLGYFIAIAFILLYLSKILDAKQIFKLAFLFAYPFIIKVLITGIFISSVDATNIVALNTNSLNMRFYIWRSAFAMIQHMPWYGYGYNGFVNMYLQYRNPIETSYGLFAHNDYIQMLVNFGYPGLILFLALIFSSFKGLVKFCKNELSYTAKIDAICLFGVLLTAAIHSLFSYDFFILQTTILIGVFFARYHMTIITKCKVYFVIDLSSKKKIISILLLVPLFIGILALVGFSYSSKAGQEFNANHYEVAMQYYDKAAKFYPTAEIEFWRGNIFSKVMFARQLKDEQFKTFFQLSMALLKRSIKLNPYEGRAYHLIGVLYYQWMHRFNDPSVAPKIEYYFQQALKINPFLSYARVDYAKVLYTRGAKQRAFDVLDARLQYPLNTGIKLQTRVDKQYMDLYRVIKKSLVTS